MTTQLETATTDELWDELKRRHSACLFAYVRDAKQKDCSVFGLKYSGTIVAAYGLAKYAERTTLDELLTPSMDTE